MARTITSNVVYDRNTSTSTLTNDTQSNWLEKDRTSAEYIKNKPFINVDDGVGEDNDHPSLQTTNGLLKVNDEVIKKIDDCFTSLT